MKKHILIGSLLVIISLLGFDFILFPKLTGLVGGVISKTPGLVEALRMKMIYFSAGYIIAVCLINLFIYNKLKSFDDEKQRIENMFKINSQDKSLSGKVDSIKNKADFYGGLLEGVIKVEVGFAVSGMLYLVIVPIWAIALNPF